MRAILFSITSPFAGGSQDGLVSRASHSAIPRLPGGEAPPGIVGLRKELHGWAPTGASLNRCLGCQSADRVLASIALGCTVRTQELALHYAHYNRVMLHLILQCQQILY